MKLAADAPIDLQMHTVLSDGAWTPEALLDHLKREGFAAAAITDHDRPDINPLLQALAAERGFFLLPAVEMSTHWRGDMVDVLCFGFEHNPNSLQAIADEMLQRQQASIHTAVAGIAAQGYPLPEAAVTAILAEPIVQMPHSLVALVKQHGYGMTEVLAGQLLVPAGLEQVTTEIGRVVAAAQESGGVCLIAHPGRSDYYVPFDAARLDDLRAEIPIDGFEVYYPKHSPAQVAMFSAYAERHGLLTSAGSDSHSPERPPIKYRAELCRALLERLGVQVG